MNNDHDHLMHQHTSSRQLAANSTNASSKPRLPISAHETGTRKLTCCKYYDFDLPPAATLTSLNLASEEETRTDRILLFMSLAFPGVKEANPISVEILVSDQGDTALF